MYGLSEGRAHCGEERDRAAVVRCLASPACQEARGCNIWELSLSTSQHSMVKVSCRVSMWTPRLYRVSLVLLCALSRQTEAERFSPNGLSIGLSEHVTSTRMPEVRRVIRGAWRSSNRTFTHVATGEQSSVQLTVQGISVGCLLFSARIGRQRSGRCVCGLRPDISFSQPPRRVSGLHLTNLGYT